MLELPLHPIVVHLPMALVVIIPVVALVVLALSWRDGIGWKQWVVVPVLAAMLAGGAFAASQTGEQDEEAAERVVPEAAIEAHEEAAERFLIASGLLLLGSLLVLAPKPVAGRKGLAVLTAAGSLGVLALGVDVGHKGGELVYRYDAASVHASGAAPSTTSVASHEVDDDD